MLAKFSYFSKYLTEELENIQRSALRIIFPVLSYQEALKECNIATLLQRRQLLTERLFSYMAFCRHVILVL